MITKSKTVNKPDKQEASKRIINAAACLFARKGYAAVGIREIAAKADINISMISYYYGGKAGLLKTLVEEYYQRVDEISVRVSGMNLSPKEAIKEFVSEMVNLIRREENLCKVGILEMPIEVPEIAKMKTARLRHNAKLIIGSLAEQFKILDYRQHVIIGPAFLSMIYSGFLFREIVDIVMNGKMNDEFFDNYSATISDLFLEGMKGITSKQKTK